MYGATRVQNIVAIARMTAEISGGGGRIFFFLSWVIWHNLTAGGGGLDRSQILASKL